MSKSIQKATDSTIGGTIEQSTDASNATQNAERVNATGLEQKINSNEQSLGLGKYKAKGVVAVIVLMIIVLAFFVLQV